MKGPPAAAPTGKPEAKPANFSSGVATILRGSNEAKPEAEAQPTALQPAEPTTPPPAEQVSAAPAQQSAEASPAPSPAPSRRLPKRLLQVSLVLTDGLLLALASRLVLRAGAPLGFGDVVLCTLAFAIGAWLTCLALRWD
jgi:hypothetical protein